MKIVHISTADLRHGAGIAAYRLHNALRNAGHTSRMIVAEKTSNDPDVDSLVPTNQSKLVRQVQNLIELGINTCGAQNIFSFFDKTLINHPFIQEADIIHCHNLHWPFKNFSLNFLNIGHTKPLIWTLHDMWALTGHCYHSLNCKKWETGCSGGCPQLFSFIPLAWDSSPMQWNIKKNIYKNTNFTIVTPSQWLTELANKSPLMSRHNAFTVPNIVDTDIFKMLNKSFLRKNYGFTESENLILFIAGNINVPVKGLPFLLDALQTFNHTDSNTTLLLVGKGALPNKYKNHIKHKHFGKINELQKLTEIYNLADITVVPSIAESFGNVVAESMSCGTPVVGSKIGGFPDMIDHKVNGFLFEPGNISALNQGIEYFLSNEKILIHARQAAREKILKSFSADRITAMHLDLYEKCLMNFNPYIKRP